MRIDAVTMCFFSVSAAKDGLLTIAPMERLGSGKNACVTLNKPCKLTAGAFQSRRDCLDLRRKGDAGVVDENIECVDLIDCPLELVASSVRGVTRSSAFCRTPRVPA
jgi:hypothetical protein